MEIHKSDIKNNLDAYIGVELYAWLIIETEKGNKIKIDTGIMKVTPTGMTKSFFGIPCVDYNVLKFYKKPKLSGENIKELLNESNLMSVLVFYDTFEHASQDYDRYVLSLLCEPCLNKKEIESFRKMLINDISDIELAKLWYSALDESQKNYLKLLGFKYND